MKIFRFLLITLLLFPARISFAQSLRESEGPRAMQWLKQNGQRYGISQDMLKGAYVADAVPSRKSGAFHVYVQQVHDDVRVLNGIAGVTFGSDRLFFNLNDNFCKAQFPAKQMLISEAEATEKAIPGKLSPEESFKREKHSLSAASFKNGTVRYEENGIYTEPMWVPAEDGTVVLCWNITFYQNSTGDWHNIFINAANGKTEKEINWTLHCAFGKHVPSVKNITAAATAQTALASDGATYNVFAFPIESPNHGNRALISSPADDVASPFGWHDTNGADGPEYSITRGNNVYAALDQVADNVPEGSPDGGSGLFFSYAYSSSSAPSDFEDFAVTQLFYANNVLHDIAYHYGFDEASGNFQENNYGKGGSGSDGVNADAQDGSGTNNANFSTPPDGTNSRMQMYLWNNSGAAGLLVKSPSNIAKLYKVGVAQFGAKLTKVPVSGKLVAVSDASSKPQKGCASFTNPSAVSGNIALIERGNCTFGRKTWNAQNAGAIAVIIYDTTTSGALITMAADNSIQDPLEIPAVFISRADGLALKNELANDVQVSLYDSSGAAGTLDADLDNGVMAHEYGHGISIRLTCGPSNSNGLSNQEQMGEGWSDFFSLAYTAKPGDAGSTPRGIGTYLIGEPITGGGIRTYPYTTDMGINLHTYNSIKTESVPHGVGSVWCAMLWREP